MKLLKYLGFFAAITFLGSCGVDEEPVSSCPELSESFQENMFSTYRDDIILPAYRNAANALNELNDAYSVYSGSNNLSDLTALQDAFKQAYISWEAAEPFYFGPAENQVILDHFNFFPLELDSMQISIDNGLDTEKTEFYDRGFPAMDYLFFEGGETIVQERLSDEATKTFVQANLDNMINRLQAVIADWEGDFGNTFANTLGRVDGASLSQIINSFNRHYETIKRDRVGLASGVLTLNFTNPDVVEGYYSGISYDLLLASFNAFKTYYYGGEGTDSPNGLYALLNSLDIQLAGASLAAEIDNGIKASQASMDLIDGDLSIAVNDQTAEVKALYQNLVDVLLLTKTEMPTALCISITYVDNPSDSD